MSIAGIFRYDSNKEGTSRLKAEVESMADALRHRSQACFYTEGSGFCLVSNHEEDPCDSLVVVYSGQFFNMNALKAELSLPDNAPCATVLKTAFKKWGNDFITHISGEFTIALYDKALDRLLLTRDRVGLRPLFYSCNNSGISFSSEVNALLRNTGDRQINYPALHAGILLHCVYSKEHLIKGIFELRAGHCLSLDFRNKKLVINKYWDRAFAIVNRAQEDYENEFKRLLNEAVKRRIPASGQKAGIALSGGIDSTLVLALVRKFHTGPVATYTVIADKDTQSEYHDARIAAARFDTEHHEIRVNARETMQNIPQIIWHMGELTSAYWFMSIASQMFFVGKAAKEDRCTSVFTGNAFELNLDGSKTPRKMYRLLHNSQKCPQLLRDHILPHLLPDKIRKILEPRGLYLWSTDDMKHIEEKYIMFTSAWGWESQLKKFYTQSMTEKIGAYQAKNIFSEYLTDCTAHDYFNKLLYIRFKAFSNLAAADRLFSAFGLMAQIPYLDVDLVQFTSSMPIQIKHNFTNAKYFIRKAYNNSDVLPISIFNKGKKESSPRFDYWEKEIIEIMLFFVSRLKKRDIFREKFVDRLLSKSGRAVEGWDQHFIFGLFILELWHRIFIDRPAIKTDDLTLDYLSRD